jgi:ParB family transcriptional regulator, chromosome partitioning protein
VVFTQHVLVSILKQYLRTDLLPEYIDIVLMRHSPLNARASLSNLDSLMLSIKQNGLLQPIIVRPNANKFEVVAGNRRLEACKRLHWVRIPCLVKELSDKQAYEIGLIENIERETLTPVEMARAFQQYVKEKGWGGVRTLAQTIGRSEEYVSHKIALLSLPPSVLELIDSEKISPSSAHELVWMKNEKDQKRLAKAIVAKKLSAKKVREIVVVSRSSELAINNIVEGVHTTKTKREKSSVEKAVTLLDKSTLTLRICVLRLDSIIEELDNQVVNSDGLKDLLIKKRLNVHNQIDELIRFKKSINIV